MFVQVPPQLVCPVGQAQLPPWQVWPPVQATPGLLPDVAVQLPRAPQWVGSVRPFTQLLPHVASLLGHASTHTEALHTWPVEQVVVQPPQCDGSLVMFVQAPPQAVWPAGQHWVPERVWPVGHLHTPAWQVSPPVQTTLQWPQLVGSVRKFVQNALLPLPHASGVTAAQAQVPFVHCWPSWQGTPALLPVVPLQLP